MKPDGTAHSRGSPGIDVRAMLPLIRAQSAEVAVEHLAAIAGANALAVLQSRGMRDPTDPASPVWRLAEAQAHLVTACWRYRVSTGRDEGLALARTQLTQAYGPELADYALRPLTVAATDHPELDAILAGDTPEPLPPEPEATPVHVVPPLWRWRSGC